MADVAVVVAVGEGERGAEVGAPERVRFGVGEVLEVLGSRDDAGVFEELPGGVELASSASVPLGVEARVLGAQGEGDGAVRGDAEAVGGSRGGPEGPAAAAVGLVADVADDLGTLGEGGDGVELVGDGIFVSGEEGRMDEEIITHVVGTGLQDSVRVLD